MSIADLWVVLTVVAFFAVSVALVRGCDRIIGSDDDVADGTDKPDPPDEAADAVVR